VDESNAVSVSGVFSGGDGDVLASATMHSTQLMINANVSLDR